MVQALDHDSVSMRMHARPEAIYDIVADVTRTPELSPEVVEASWLDGATGPVVGARFKARNKVSNRPTFSNKPVVTAADRGRIFSFARTEPFAGTIEWSYRFEPEGDETLVTESYDVTKPVSRIGWFIIGGLFARKNRREDLRSGMEQTLARLRSLAEQPVG